jgi:hypothetical protein
MITAAGVEAFLSFYFLLLLFPLLSLSGHTRGQDRFILSVVQYSAVQSSTVMYVPLLQS